MRNATPARPAGTPTRTSHTERDDRLGATLAARRAARATENGGPWDTRNVLGQEVAEDVDAIDIPAAVQVRPQTRPGPVGWRIVHLCSGPRSPEIHHSVSAPHPRPPVGNRTVRSMRGSSCLPSSYGHPKRGRAWHRTSSQGAPCRGDSRPGPGHPSQRSCRLSGARRFSTGPDHREPWGDPTGCRSRLHGGLESGVNRSRCVGGQHAAVRPGGPALLRWARRGRTRHRPSAPQT